MKKIILSIFSLLLISHGVFAYSPKQIQDSILIMDSFIEGEDETAGIKMAATIIKAHFEDLEEYMPDLSERAELISKVNSVCTTTFCGKGIKGGLEQSKNELRGTNLTTSDSITTVVLGLVNFALPFAGLFAFVGMIYGGFLYITSFAEDQTETAKNIMIWSGTGIIIIYLAYSIVSTFVNIAS